MRDFDDAAGNDEAIGCEKIKCRNGGICFVKRLDWRLKSFGPAEIRAQDDSRGVVSVAYGLEAESMKATMLDLSLVKSSSRRYIMWPAS